MGNSKSSEPTTQPMIKVVYHTQLTPLHGESFAEVAKGISDQSARNNKGTNITGLFAVDVDLGKAIQVSEIRIQRVIYHPRRIFYAFI
jgi:hypothetical protein